MADFNTDFVNKLQEIKELYIEVKEVMILAENFDPKHEVYLSPVNELRNALDHVMRCLIYPKKMDEELNESKEHLYRAGYDAYEVLSINVADQIVKTVEGHNVKTIATVFPKYYSEIKQELVDIKIELAEERAHKRLTPDTGTKSFTPYKEKITKLIKHLKVCNVQIPVLQKEKRRRRIISFSNIIIVILTSIVAIIAGTYIYDTFIKHNPPTIKSEIVNPAEVKKAIK